MRDFWRCCTCFLLLVISCSLHAAPVFPERSDWVVDQAGILSLQNETNLRQQLKAIEETSSNQIVVVTLDSLQGYDISEYGYQLGRHWGVGTKDRNNGALLIVAPNDRKVRIEVGYGLEGHLTDSLSHNIIQTQILPHFRQGDFNAGIQAGVKAIVQAIEGSYQPIIQEQNPWMPLVMFLLIVVVFFLMSRHSERLYGNAPGRYGSHRRSRNFPFDDFGGPGDHGGYIGGRGGGMGGGFGGGSFGGGGASGGW